MTSEQQYYNQEYYNDCLGDMPYAHGYGWEKIFSTYADRIKKEIAPARTLDVGCAIGFMVEALHDKGIEAYGIDISEYAISQVREDIRPFCKVKDATLSIDEKYDLITCIEVLEHMEMEQATKAIEQMCKATDDIIFSSTPFDYDEVSHISVNGPEHWAELFAYNGFYHDVDYDCSYISVQAMRFRRRKMSDADLIRTYERRLFMLAQENFAVRNRAQTNSDNVQIYKDAYQKHVDIINNELNPRIVKLESEIVELTAEKSRISNECDVRVAELTEQVKSEVQSAKDEAELRIRNEKEEFCKKLEHEYEQKYAEAKSDLKNKYYAQLKDTVAEKKRNEELYYATLNMLDVKSAELDEARCMADIRNKGEITEPLLVHTTSLMGGGIRKLLGEYRLEQKRTKELLNKPEKYWEPVFDYEYYVQMNPDVAEYYNNNAESILKHFIRYGMSEGRKSIRDFDVFAYARYNSDVKDKYRSRIREYYIHYIEYGMAEKRKALD